jgi:N-acyl-D-amino-acid deacylase
MKLAALFVFGLVQVGCTPNDSTSCNHPSSDLPVGPSLVIADAMIIDGSGNPRYTADVRISQGLVTKIGDICASSDDPVLDGTGLILAPGFIDTHSHHDRDPEESKALGAISQGITTIVIGADGFSQAPIQKLVAEFAAKPMPTNVASFSGHNTVRALVMGIDFRREATNEEIQEMANLLRDDMRSGALGLSTGLEYDPGIYSSTAEVIELAKLASDSGGRYTSHIRSEDRNLTQAIDEFIEIAREADVSAHLSHIKIAIVDLWGTASEIIRKLDEARNLGLDITADVYPYAIWQSTLTVLLPERDFTDIDAAQYALDHLAPADGLILGAYKPNPTLVGKSVAEIANIREQGEAETYLQLINDAYPTPQRPGEFNEFVIGRSMNEEDIATFVKWEHANITSDGASNGGHPRGYGSFPRAIRKYSREKKSLSLEAMIKKMTSKAASNVGLKNRGRVEVGAPADLVLFSEAEITDKATIESPELTATGIHGVWVNGVLVWNGKKPTGLRPGVFIPREG